MLKIIDPHLHLFALNKGNYRWLKPDSAPLWPDKNLIHKDFFESSLHLPAPYQLHGFVHIEAGYDNLQPWREIDWLESHCTLPFKSVAFTDITATTFEQHINQLNQYQSLVGIRHILDEHCDAILSAPQTSTAFDLLQQLNLSFDAQLDLTDSHAVDRLILLMESRDKLRLIINHAGWPPNIENDDKYQRWRQNTLKLATLPNVAIKLSGWEMSNRNWQVHQVIPIIQHCIKIFGENRVMLASNFPLCTFSYTYETLWQGYATLDSIEPETLQKLTFSNAAHWYQFDS